MVQYIVVIFYLYINRLAEVNSITIAQAHHMFKQVGIGENKAGKLYIV